MSEWRPYEPSREAESQAARNRAVAALVTGETEFPCSIHGVPAGEWCPCVEEER